MFPVDNRFLNKNAKNQIRCAIFRKFKFCCSDGSGTRKPENPTRPEGFLLARTRPEPEKVQTRPENPKKPEFLEK